MMGRDKEGDKWRNKMVTGRLEVFHTKLSRPLLIEANAHFGFVFAIMAKTATADNDD